MEPLRGGKLASLPEKDEEKTKSTSARRVHSRLGVSIFAEHGRGDCGALRLDIPALLKLYNEHSVSGAGLLLPWL